MRILLFVFLSFFLFACDKENLSATKTRATDELAVLIRENEMSYLQDEEVVSGFEYELLMSLGEALNLPVRFIVAKNDQEIFSRLKKGDAHLAAGWQIAAEEPEIKASEPFFATQNVLIQHEASVPITKITQLNHEVVHVIAGSRQEYAAKIWAKERRELTFKSVENTSELSLLHDVATQKISRALVDRAFFDATKNYYPELNATLEIGKEAPIVWLFALDASDAHIAGTNDFIQKVMQNGDLARLKDRYFGHIKRLNEQDAAFFIENIKTRLPQFRPLFQEAQLKTGVDWRVLAALAYQESKWTPDATSPTGVRGMMMLTENTADHYKVQNRLDPAESIRAGATYLAEILDWLPREITLPDRLWMALATYNIGQGHFNAARGIAKSEGFDPNSWFEMKKALPLLANPLYYARLKSGKGRGGEAVILAENVRGYSEILRRFEPAFDPMQSLTQAARTNNRSLNLRQ